MMGTLVDKGSKEDNVIGLERNNAEMVKWTCNVRSKDKISAVKLGNIRQLNTMRKRLQKRRFQYYGHLERTEKNLTY